MVMHFNYEESYEGMISRLHESYCYGRFEDSYDDEQWCLRDDPDFDDVRAA